MRALQAQGRFLDDGERLMDSAKVYIPGIKAYAANHIDVDLTIEQCREIVEEALEWREKPILRFLFFRTQQQAIDRMKRSVRKIYGSRRKIYGRSF